jgi:peptidoglycan/xylan/chitin deacetylase (PgdA/CDA1 family)
MTPQILISFDVEEFDMPLEYGFNLPPDKQLEIGFHGLEAITPLLNQSDFRTTLFTTANFADHFSSSIKYLSDKHEIASHTYYHSFFEIEHLQSSRLRLEQITGKPVTGLRMPRMKQVPMEAINNAGYGYDASMNPTWLPGRYNHLNEPRSYHIKEGVFRIPASVSSGLRLPLFWLSFKNFPYTYYLHLCKQVLKKDGYLSLYFHPWEFVDVTGYGLPAYTTKYARQHLLDRLYMLLEDLKPHGNFSTMQQFASDHTL